MTRFLAVTSSQIGLVSTATGTLSLRPQRSVLLTDIASNAQGALFGVTTNSLYRLNRSTGSSRLVGRLGPLDMNALGFTPSGALYAAGGSGFYRVSLATGRATLIRRIPGFSSSGDIAYDPISRRFLATSFTGGSDTLFSIALNGNARRIGSIGFGNVYGLYFDRGVLYGYTSDRRQITINKNTGRGTFRRVVRGTSDFVFGAT